MTYTFSQSAEFNFIMVDGEPRISDANLTKWLGLPNPRITRDVIENHIAPLQAMGAICKTRIPAEYYLNYRQAATVVTKLDTSTPHTVNPVRWVFVYEEIVEQLISYENKHKHRPNSNHQTSTSTYPNVAPKDIYATFTNYHKIAKLVGVNHDQATLAANTATYKATGINPLDMMDIMVSQDFPETETETETEDTEEAWIDLTRAAKMLGVDRNHLISCMVRTGWFTQENGELNSMYVNNGRIGRHVDGTVIIPMGSLDQLNRNIQPDAPERPINQRFN